ncbi:SEL1-like repeat protein [Hyphococcus sp.]|uniref:SEL1-like repeat protein n=1 Tax=Hyphococcus sp. TaxID=2038636 RepID=UPI00208486E5|nr:MAG: hypothetical protein DHS20C04_16300 [Marinicaulis sp.]
MKSNAPWSVKGIERDARETAKEAARREGMTVGEWLNQMIYSQADGGATGALAETEVEGLRLRDIVTAIEHLRNRVVEAESKHSAAVNDLTRNMGGFVERVQRLERVKPTEGSYQDVAQRIEKLERAGGDRHRIEALKALEKALAQVAIQFNNAQRTTLTRLDSAEQQLQEFAERIDRVGNADSGETELGPLKSAIEGLAERVTRAERIAEEATSLKSAAAASSDPEFVEQTGARLRVLGDEIKRGGDQIRALEGTIVKLSSQIEAAEKRSADGVQKVAETITEVRAQLAAEGDRPGEPPDVEAILAAARNETEEKLVALQRSLEDINARFEELGQAATSQPEAVAPTLQEADSAFQNEEDVEAIADDNNEDILDLQRATTETSSTAKENNKQGDDGVSLDDVMDEIEEAVAAIEAQDSDAQSTAEEDPFAFADEFEETPAAQSDEPTEELESDDNPVEDFSFQLDDENSNGDDRSDDDITVSADEDDEPLNDARALLAEVRNALTSEASTTPEEAEEELTLAGDEDDDDEQAPNTASLSDSTALELETPQAAAIKPKEDMVQAARRRAREAAALNAEEQARPRRAQLSAKQRAILAARARQKRAVSEESSKHNANADATSEAASSEAETQWQTLEADTEEKREAIGGRFSKITAALSAARARLGRNKATDDDTPEAIASPAPVPEEEPTPRRNGDRAALETLRSTASARPLTIALGAAILLAVAALVYLVKDFVFKPDATPQPAVSTTQSPAALEETPDETDASLAVVPEAPSIDPQSLYIDSIDALSAAGDETAARAAIEKLQDAAALGYPPAQLQLGELYKTGQGVEQDLGQARVWFRRAANGGNVLAMHRIGVMTARGDGGPADAREAIAWFEQAANFGLVDSQYNLGAIYHPSETGASAVQNTSEAYYWYSLAARNGDDQAQPLAAGVAAALSPQERAAVDARVAAWSAEAADEAANLNANTN